MRTIVWMSGALVSFCVMAIAARELAGAIPTFQMLFVRSAIGLIAVTALLMTRQQQGLFRTRRLGLHVGRNALHFCGQYGWFLGIGLLPLAQVFALEFTTPLWTLILASLVLKERLTVKKTVAVLLGSVGVYLVLNPGRSIVSAAALYVIAAAIFYSASHVCTKALSATEDPLTVLFYMCLVQLPIGLLLGGHGFVAPTALQWIWLALIGLTALTAHFCITYAMRTAEASVVVTLDFLRLPLIALVGVVFYNEPFELTLVLGAAIMLAGNLVNTWKPKPPSPGKQAS